MVNHLYKEVNDQMNVNRRFISFRNLIDLLQNSFCLRSNIEYIVD